MDQTDTEFFEMQNSQKTNFPLASSLMLAFGVGCVASQFFKRKSVKAQKINEVDERLRRALQEEDLKTSAFPKEVDLSPAYD